MGIYFRSSQALSLKMFLSSQICSPLPSLMEIKEHVKNSLKMFRQDHLRALNPTPYKVDFDNKLTIKCHCRVKKTKKKNEKHTSQVAHTAGAYPGFRIMKRLGVLLLLLDGMLVHRR